MLDSVERILRVQYCTCVMCRNADARPVCIACWNGNIQRVVPRVEDSGRDSRLLGDNVFSTIKRISIRYCTRVNPRGSVKSSARPSRSMELATSRWWMAKCVHWSVVNVGLSW